MTEILMTVTNKQVQLGKWTSVWR